MKKYIALILTICMIVIALPVFAFEINKSDYSEGDVLFSSDFEIFEPGEHPTGLGNTNAIGSAEWITVPAVTGGGVVLEEDTGNKFYRFYNDTSANVTATFVQYFNMSLQGIDAFRVEYDFRSMGVAFYSRWRDSVGSQNTFFTNLSRNAGDIFSKNIQPDVWNHVEAVVDNNKNIMQVWVNGTLATEELFQQVYTSNKTICTLTLSATLYPGDEAFLDNVKVTKLIPLYSEEDAVLQGNTIVEDAVKYVPSKTGMPTIGEQIELGEAAFNETSTQTGGGLTSEGHRTYVSMNANPSYFNEFDTLTGEYIRSIPVNESSFYYAFQVGSDGKLYHSGGPEIYQYDPKTKVNKKIETYITDATGTAWGMNLGVSGDNSKLYNAHWLSMYYTAGKGMPVAEYDVKTGKTNVYYGVGGELKYTHAATGNEDYVFCSGGDDAGSERLIRVDKKTGEKLIWYNTDPDIQAGNVGQCILVGDKLFTRIRAWSFCIDIDTMTEFARFESGTRGGRQSITYPKPDGDPNIVYYLTPNQVGLNTFNIKTGEIGTSVEKFDYSMTDLGKIEFGQWIQKKDGTWAIYACVADTHVALITPGDPHIEYIELKAPSLGLGTSVQPNYYHITRDDILYVGGYRAGINGFDLKSNTPVFAVRQNSQHGIAEANGMIFGGTYSSGNFYMIDPEKPVVKDSGNPKYIYTSKFGCRHYNVSGTNAGFCMFSGIADYGQTQGSVIMTTYADGEPKTKEYGGIAPGENIVGMCYKDGYIYAGSSVMVNLQEPHEEAHVVKLDAKTGEVLLTRSYDIEGFGKIGMIGEMAVGPDGLIYTIANQGVTLLALDPETLDVVKQKTYLKQREVAASVVSPWLRFGAEGVLYTNMGEQLYSINIETLEATLLWNNCDRFALDNDGNILKRRGGNSTGTILVAMQVDQRQRLDIMIANALKYYKEDNYSKASWKMFENALSDAKKIDLNKDSGEKVKEAARKLSFAIQDLQTKYDEEAGFAYIFGDNLASFDDMKGYSADTLKAVNTLKHSKIISGLDNKTFAPEKAITRAEFVKLLAVIEGCEDEVISAYYFSDVAKDSWYYNYVQTAYEKGWILGKTETEFAPDEPITEEQMILILNRIKENAFEPGKSENTTRANAAKLLYEYINM